MGYSIIKQDDNTSYNVKEYIIDTEEDLASVPTTCAPGSKVTCISTGNVYMINSNKEYTSVGSAKTVTTPDWNENDDSASDYIKNRTHWKSSNYIDGTVVDMNSATNSSAKLIDQTMMGSVLAIGFSLENSGISSFNVGDKYSAIIEGIRYDNLEVQLYDYNNTFYLGEYFMASSLATEEYNFCFFNYDGEIILYLRTNSRSWDTAKEYKLIPQVLTTEYNTIDYHYLPDGGDGIGYTTGQEYTDDIVLDMNYTTNSSIIFTDSHLVGSVAAITLSISSLPFTLQEGDIYSVIIEGVRYDNILVQRPYPDSNVYYLGSMIMSELSPEYDYCFYYENGPGATLFLSMNNTNSYDFTKEYKIIKRVLKNNYHEIKPQYLPDSGEGIGYSYTQSVTIDFNPSTNEDIGVYTGSDDYSKITYYEYYTDKFLEVGDNVIINFNDTTYNLTVFEEDDSPVIGDNEEVLLSDTPTYKFMISSYIYEENVIWLGLRNDLIDVNNIQNFTLAFNNSIYHTINSKYSVGKYYNNYNGEIFNDYDENIASGFSSHAEGCSTVASASFAHAEGNHTAANSFCSHAEGNFSTASRDYAHVEGNNTTASGTSSHAEGEHTTVSTIARPSNFSSAFTFTNGIAGHAEGSYTYVYGGYGHAEGFNTYAQGATSHAEGYRTIASAAYSHAEGYSTTASNYASHASGKYNATMTTGGAIGNTTGTAFVVGNGNSSSATSNAFSVMYNGTVKSASTYTASTTADYAEFFEWLDENPDSEDRVGHFVTLDGDKIKIASGTDDYILGVISGEPFVLGNGDCDVWNGMFLHDEYRRTKYEPAPKVEEIKDEKGNFTGEYKEIEGEYEGTRPVLNPEYDSTKQYISRFDRKEWAPVGMLGVLAVNHDGTAAVNGYITVNDEGIGTACEKSHENSYRVIKLSTDKVCEIIFR